MTRPWPFVVACLALAVACGLLASRLELRTRFEELLPQARSSVVELKRLQASTQAGSHVHVVVEGGGLERQRAFGDALVARMKQQAPSWLVDCADGVQDARAFLQPRAGMFAPLGELTRVRDQVEARWNWEVARETGANLDDDEPAPSLDFTDLKQRLGVPEKEQFPDGYFQSTAKGALVVVVETSLTTGDLKQQRAALNDVRHQTDELLHDPRFAGLRANYAGDLVTGLEEYGAAVNDLLGVGAAGLGLVTLALFLFFMRVRALMALATTLAVGLLWTFGVTYLAIGHLNVATGFLISIVAGNGINFGIIFVARVYEELRKKHRLQDAIETASLLTRRATLSAALVASAAYASLAISDFRAFRHFAVIGGAGMLLCWLASFLFLPSLLLVVESWRAGAAKGATLRTGYGERYGAPLAAAAGHFSKALTFGGAGLVLLGGFALWHYLHTDPLEYDMRRMQNDLGSAAADMYRASKLAGGILGAARDGSMVMLADNPEQARDLSQALRAKRDAAPADAKPFEAVHTVFDFVPDQQAEKLPVLLALRERLLKAHRRGFVSDADFAKVEPFLPPAELSTWSPQDLPSELQRPFRDKLGRLGRLLLIEPTAGQSDSDVKYLMRWADSFREVRLPDGARVRGSGRAVIFADILETVLHDIPRTVLASLGMTLLIVLVTCRSRARVALVLGALVVGLGGVALLMDVFHIKINFFNFVALPVSFGIGADYAVNFVGRYEEDPEQGALAVLRSTGGAILLCSLTTTLGYLALLFSVNQAIRSLGTLAVLGEICCLAAATLALPGYLVWRERAARRRLSDADLAGGPGHAAAVVAGDKP